MLRVTCSYAYKSDHLDVLTMVAGNCLALKNAELYLTAGPCENLQSMVEQRP
jgi:hypothetical protein